MSNPTKQQHRTRQPDAAHDDSGAALREAVERYRASKPDTAEPPKPAKGPRQRPWGPISEIPGYPLNDSHSPPPAPPPVRVKTAPGGPQLWKAVRDTAPPTMEPITEMEAHPTTDDLVDAAITAGRPTGAIELPDHSEADPTPPAEAIKAKPMTSWRNLIKVHPAADEFPMMAEEELKALGEDIHANGLKMPIVFYNDGAGGGGISLLDGRNRLEAMELSGYYLDLSHSAIRDPSKTLRADGPYGKRLLVHIQHENKNPRGFTISANLRRRHLGAEDRQKWAVELRAEGQSTRQIAEALGTTAMTVRRDLAEAEASGTNVPVDRVIGKDGKSRPARMPAKAKVAPAVEELRAEEPAPEGAAPAAPSLAEQPEVKAALIALFNLRPNQRKVITYWIERNWKKQQLREHVTAELPMSKLLADRWPSMSGGEKAEVHSFLAAEQAKFETVRPAAPAAQNGAAAS
jgi:hypothetical protein